MNNIPHGVSPNLRPNPVLNGQTTTFNPVENNSSQHGAFSLPASQYISSPQRTSHSNQIPDSRIGQNLMNPSPAMGPAGYQSVRNHTPQQTFVGKDTLITPQMRPNFMHQWPSRE
jgi:hypothetical protein